MSMTMDQLSKVWYNDKMEIYASIKKKRSKEISMYQNWHKGDSR